MFKEYKIGLQKRINYEKFDLFNCIDEDHKLLQSQMILSFRDAPKMCDEKMAKECEIYLKYQSDEYFKEWMSMIRPLYKMHQQGKIDIAMFQRQIRENEKAMEKWKSPMHYLCKVLSLGFLDCE